MSRPRRYGSFVSCLSPAVGPQSEFPRQRHPNRYDCRDRSSSLARRIATIVTDARSTRSPDSFARLYASLSRRPTCEPWGKVVAIDFPAVTFGCAASTMRPIGIAFTSGRATICVSVFGQLNMVRGGSFNHSHTTRAPWLSSRHACPIVVAASLVAIKSF